MRRSISIVCALGLAILLGAIVSLAGESSKGKSAEKQPASATDGRNQEDAIEAALEKHIDCDLKNMPFGDAVAYFSEKLGIEIYIDPVALKEEGHDLKTPVSCHARGLRFRYALARLLDPLLLNFGIHDDALHITSFQKQSEFVENRVYDVADLVVFQDGKGPYDDYEPLIDAISYTISPATWDHNGGKGSICGVTLGTAKVLLVSQTLDVHREIVELLASIRAVAAKKIAGDGIPNSVSWRRRGILDPQPAPAAK